MKRMLKTLKWTGNEKEPPGIGYWQFFDAIGARGFMVFVPLGNNFQAFFYISSRFSG